VNGQGTSLLGGKRGDQAAHKQSTSEKKEHELEEIRGKETQRQEKERGPREKKGSIPVMYIRQRELLSDRKNKQKGTHNT